MCFGHLSSHVHPTNIFGLDGCSFSATLHNCSRDILDYCTAALASVYVRVWESILSSPLLMHCSWGQKRDEYYSFACLQLIPIDCGSTISFLSSAASSFSFSLFCFTIILLIDYDFPALLPAPLCRCHYPVIPFDECSIRWWMLFVGFVIIAVDCWCGIVDVRWIEYNQIMSDDWENRLDGILKNWTLKCHCQLK